MVVIFSERYTEQARSSGVRFVSGELSRVGGFDRREKGRGTSKRDKQERLSGGFLDEGSVVGVKFNCYPVANLTGGR